MTSKELYNAFLEHLSKTTSESLEKDWKLLKQYNTGILVSEYKEYVCNISDEDAVLTKNKLNCQF